MEALWRWTRSGFLVLALNICCWCQNIGPSCSLPQQVLPGESLRDCNPGLVNPQRQINNALLYPPNGLVSGGPTAQEYQRPAFEDRICSQNQPTNVVTKSQDTCAYLGPVNAQTLQCASCIEPGLACNTPGLLLPPQSVLPQNQCLNGQAAPPCLPQQNIGLLPMEFSPTQGPFLPFNQGTLLGQRPSLTAPPFTPLIPTAPFTNDIFQGNNFPPLAPIVNSEFQTPFREIFPCQETVLPPIQSTSTCPPDNPLKPSNIQGGSDVLPAGPLQYASGLNAPLVNSIFALQNRLPTQGSILPSTQINCLPQGPTECDILPETQTKLGPILQNPIPFSPFNFRFPRPALFSSTNSLGPLTNNFPLPCDPPANIQNQVSVCNPALNQQEPICAEVSISPATCMTNTLSGLPNQNVQLFPLQSSYIPQFPLNSVPCSLSTDIAPINFLPPPTKPTLCAIPQNGLGAVLPQTSLADCPSITPLNISPPFKGELLLPTSSNGPCDSIRPYPSVVADNVPIPINLQINIPPPVIPAPTITIINTTPDGISTGTEDDFFNLQYPMPPIIIEGKRSRSRSWLPLVLVALFARDGDFGCSCDSGPIPIPYPIPIPTNNPVIVNK